MKGDFSRDNFDPKKHYSAVLMQQGRVQLDADWNEQQATHQYRIETATQDLIGGNGTPDYQPGFDIIADSIQTEELKRNKPAKYEELKNRRDLPLGECDFLIGSGRYYVDGILCENDDFVRYRNQPDFPKADTSFTPETTYLVYLDVWRRHITALDDTDIREKALGGPDTTTRIKTVWQVKLIKVADNYTCDIIPSEWTPPTGKLTAGRLGASYEGLDNHLYRVEVHEAGTLGTATFKWSRDNGSIVTAITGGGGNQIIVADLGPDDARGFAEGQWVEIVDDENELHAKPGQLTKIKGNPDPATRTITLSGAVNIDFTKRPKLRRWDGCSKVERPTTTADGWIHLEYEIYVQFGEGTYKTGDYWLIPARPGTAPNGIEWPIGQNKQPIAQPPRAIQNRDGHHYAPLALLELQSDQKFKFKGNCRTFFHPLAAKDLDQMAKDLKQMQARLDAMQFKPFKDIDESWCPEMVELPAGEFMMGSPPQDQDAEVSEKPQHIVRIPYRFAIGRYPVTFEEYEHFCKEDGRKPPSDQGWGRGRRPVINVSWNEAEDYCKWLSKKTKQSYRLPSEAEWEYACRAGTRTRYAFGDQITAVDANFFDSNQNKTTEVGSYLPNPWGLCDMHGNVWEWTQDTWHENYQGAPTDGSAWEYSADAYRVLRGGSWSGDARDVRAASRDHVHPDYRVDLTGFRCARVRS